MGERGATLLRWSGLCVMLLAVALVYWPGLTGPFLFDDFPALVNNPRVHVESLSFNALWRAALSFGPGGTGRQLAMLTFALNHAVDGMNPWGWKLGGLLVHLLNTVLIYLLCQRLLALAGVKSQLRLSAAALTLLWAAHPLQVSTVLYVVQRMETLSLTFVLMALLAYLHGRSTQIAGGRGWPWLASCVPLLLLALGCKESALLLPLYTLALELTLLRFAGATTGQQRFWRWGYGAGCVIGVLLFFVVVVPVYTTTHYELRDFNAWERVLTQLRILPMYLAQILLPLPASMTFYYDDLQVSHSLFQPLTTLWGGLLLFALLIVAWFARKRAPLLSLGILWFFAGHAITSNVIALELVFEHRNYFALLGVLLVLAELVRRIPVRDGPGIKIAGVAALVVGVGFLGAVRSATWGETLLLSTDLAALNPQSARAAQDLGILYYAMSDGSVDSPFFSFAVRQLQRETELPHASILGEQSLIHLYAANGLEVDPRWWEQLHRRLRDRPISHETTGALFKLLSARMDGVQMDDMALGNAFLILFERKKMPPYSYAAVALHALKYRHDQTLAKQLLQQAVDVSDEYPGYLDQLQERLRTEGYPEFADWVRAQAASKRQGG